MNSEDPRITYHKLIDDDDPDGEPIGIVRRIHAEPISLDEAYGRDGEWHPTEYLKRYLMLGSTDIDHEEIGVAEAEAIISRWRSDWGLDS